MLRRKMERAKTQKKQGKKVLPELKLPKRLITSNSFFASNQIRKLSQTVNKESVKRNKFEIKKCVDENYVQLMGGKNSLKFSRKKFHNQSLTIQQILPSSSFSQAKIPFNSNIVDYTYDQYQGLRDYNQDRVMVTLNHKIIGKIYNFFGVFDGHGGSSTSQFVKNNFVNIFEQCVTTNPLASIQQNLGKTFASLQYRLLQLSKTKAIIGGTCASVLIICQNLYYIGHLGDSRILQIKGVDDQNFNQHFKVKQLTTDHKPDNLAEKARIQSVGGRVYRNKTNLKDKDNTQFYGPYRVYPGRLSVSRTIGDFQAKKQPSGLAISKEPQIIVGQITQKTLFLVFSDGAYEQFENGQISSFFIKQKSLEQVEVRRATQSFLINSILKQSSDNISLVSVIVKPMQL